MVRYELDKNIVRLDRDDFSQLFALKDHDPFDEDAYVWDRWCELALDIGLKKEMVQLGRGVMRVFYQHDWQMFEDEANAKDHAERKALNYLPDAVPQAEGF